MKLFQFRFPRDGDVMVGEADGVICDSGLQITALVEAFAAEEITVNGVQAQRIEAGLFEAKVILNGYFNRLEAVRSDTGERSVITVYVFQRAFRTYRFTVDDFIRSFQNLHEHRRTYQSVFDDPYLKIFKDAHVMYGSKVHINAFYETDDGSFNLSMMTDRFRDEFIANADWLTFSFHARREHPDIPYQNADYNEMKRDCLIVTDELRRIVGKAAMRDTTTLHWGAANLQGTRALRTLGYRALCGYFTFCRGEPYYEGCYKDGQTIVSYYLDKGQVANLEHRCFWVDTREDIIFARLHLVLNAGDLTAGRVAPFLDTLLEKPRESGFIQMVIHEQFFYSDYVAYEPDYRERIMEMARWMQEHNYHSASLSEIICPDGVAV